jgi:hypothetical protein
LLSPTEHAALLRLLVGFTCRSARSPTMNSWREARKLKSTYIKLEQLDLAPRSSRRRTSRLNKWVGWLWSDKDTRGLAIVRPLFDR